MKKIFITIAFFSLTIICSGQTWAWAKNSIGSGGITTGSEGNYICTDSIGNVYVTGIFSNPTIAFGTTTLTNLGGGDVFLTKYDALGNLLWAKSYGSVNADIAYCVNTDRLGNVFLTGYFTGPTIVFGNYTLTTSGIEDVFLTKFDSNGNVLWAKSSGGNNSDLAYSVATDKNGNAVITGYFSSSTITFGSYTLNNSGLSSVFIAKYDNLGNVLWAKNSNGTAPLGDGGNSVSTDLNNNIFITGYFSSPTITFGAYSINNPGNKSIFLVKYDQNGNAVLANSAGGGSGNDNSGNSVSTDFTGNVFITGQFNSASVTFSTTTLYNTGFTYNVFLCKYNNAGALLWAKSANSNSESKGYSISTYSNGIFLIGGLGSPSIAFGTTTVTNSSTTGDQSFLFQFDLNGNVMCATTLDGGGDDQITVCATKNGDAYIGGDFMANPFVIGTYTLIPASLEDIFVAKYISCNSDGIFENHLSLGIKVFPNPCIGSFNLQIENAIKDSEIILINTLGQKVHEQKISQGENKIIIRDLASGLYNYIILLDKEQISNGKLTIDKN